MGRLTIITMLISSSLTLAFLLHEDGLIHVPAIPSLAKLMGKRAPASTQISQQARPQVFPQWSESESEVQQN